MTKEELLTKYWGHTGFRPLQGEIIDSVLSGHDTLALLPTGGGKSVCYQVPALMLEGVTLVVSPLIALMNDQVQQLRQRHITAACIYSGMTRRELEVILNQCIYGKTRLLYISPERLKSRLFIEHFRQMKVSLIAVDEAHCISQWGYDFRPPYLEIANIRQYHPKTPVIALTATATPTVIRDIKERLEFHNEAVFTGRFARANLSYSVFKTEDKYARLLKIVQNVKGSGIVYVRNRRRTLEIANYLNDKGINALSYHAGVESRERNRRQQAWSQSDNTVMVATNAFGMGIDKPDVRYVVHFDIPSTPEAYFQEAGRAGRDGQTAYAVLLYNDRDLEIMDISVEKQFPTVQYIKNVYKGICNYYQIPLGTGMESSHDLDLEGICNTYGFDITLMFNALKILEREGMIALPDHSDLQSKLYIPVSREELYRIQVGNKAIGDMMIAILRLYGGLFTDFATISERKIAKHCNMGETEVINLLRELNKREAVVYQQRCVHPQIVFTSERIDADDLHLSDKNYANQKRAAIERSQSMKAYATNTTICRSRTLLEYFGEKRDHDCLYCDICLQKRKERQGQGPKVTKPLETRIVENLSERALDIRELSGRMPDIEQKLLVETVRRLLDKGVLKSDQDFRMRVARAL